MLEVTKGGFMDNVATALEVLVNDQAGEQQPGPVLVNSPAESLADWVARRVAAALNEQLTNGSMPA